MKTICLTSALFCSFLLSASPLRADGKDFHDQDLEKKDFKEAALSGANFSDANLKGANFTRATLKGANFKGADLSRVNSDGADLTGAIFIEVSVGVGEPITFDRANLTRANLQGMDISGNFVGCYQTKFREADLRNTKGWGALSSDNEFSKADVRGANFRGMHFYQAESIPRFRGAIYDDDTTWPDGFDPKAAGAVLKPAEKKDDAGAAQKNDAESAKPSPTEPRS